MNRRVLLVALVVALAVAFVGLQATPGTRIGVVAEVYTHPSNSRLDRNFIQLINPDTMQLTGRKVLNQLGSVGGGLFDVVITPNGRTAIVSNFGDSRIFFIDISKGFSQDPVVLGSRKIPFFAEDMSITADGEWVLVTDGGFAPNIAVVNVRTRLLTSVFLGKAKYSNSVDITPDGNVITSDYFQGKINLLTISPTGKLVYRKSFDIMPNRPVNTAVSPDGKTVVAVSVGAPHLNLVPFLSSGFGVMTRGTQVDIPDLQGQSFAFSQDSTKGYLLSAVYTGRGPLTRIVIFDVNRPGSLSDSGERIVVKPPRGTSQLFGVDTIAIDPSGNYLWVSNPTLSGAVWSLGVVDLVSKKQVASVPTLGIPTGIAFATIQ